MLYFVDTWYLIARFDRFDAHHQQAIRLDRSLDLRDALTHDGVFTEYLAFMAAEGAVVRSKAVSTVRTYLETATAVEVERTLFKRALDMYARRPDKEYSLVDCISMTIMRDYGITRILTNDHHFRQEGFEVVSDAP